MPGISVVTFRWLLVAVNLLTLGLVLSRAHGFFQGAADELRAPLPEVASVAVPPPQQGGGSVDVSRLIADLGRKPPVKLDQPSPTPKDPVPELGPALGGPLSKWAISSVMTNPTTGEVYASLVEAQVEEPGLSPLPPSRATTPARARGRTPQPTRNPRANRGRTPQHTATKGEFVAVGDVLDETTSPCEITAIAIEPPAITYLNAGKSYRLDRVIDLPEVQIEEELDANGNLLTLVLVGRELDAEEAARNRETMEAAAPREGSISTAQPTPPAGKGEPQDRADAVKPPTQKAPSDAARHRAATADQMKQLKEALDKMGDEAPPEKRAELEQALKDLEAGGGND
ncbi:MAG: hypothetical protein AB7O52_05250 [Planctomycetota bacterium]